MRAVQRPITFLLLCAFSASALEFTLSPIDGGQFRFRDAVGRHYSTTFTNTFSYHNSQVKVTLDDSHNRYLSGLIQATGLKPNFAYQVKLGGRNSKLPNLIASSAAAPDDASNERLGYIGRWWRAFPNPANSSDADHDGHQNDPSYAYSGYLIIAFFLTDDTGAAAVRFEGNNSFHVLWRTDQRLPSPNDGPIFTAVIPPTTGNPSYDPGSSAPAANIGLYGEWEPTRALPNTMIMPGGHYACDFILTEESFHDFSIDGGNWPAALGAPIEFDIDTGITQTWTAPAAITFPAALGAAQLNAAATVPGTFTYTPPLATVLPAGTHTLAAQFKPDDPAAAAPPPVSVTLTVQKGTPHIYWNPPSAIRANKNFGRDLFNPSADVPGEFSDNFPAARALQPGAYTFTLGFVPADQANYNTPEPLTRTIDAVAGLLLTSGPLAQPNPAFAGMNVQFSAASSARGVTWDFGDGSAPVSAESAQHAYAAPGNHLATVSVKSSGGQSESESVNISVLPLPAGLNNDADADGDGFSNGFELALGSDPLSAGSTPLDGRSAQSAALHSHSRCAVRIDPQSAKLSFSARLPVANAFSPAWQRLALDVGGNVLTFTLDARGRSTAKDRRAKVRVNKQQLSIDIDAANFPAPLSGILRGPYSTSTLTAPVSILLGDTLFSAVETFTITPTTKSTLISTPQK